MSCWGTELWDQFDSIIKYEDRCSGFCEVVENFVKERTFIEEEYAKALRRLIKSVQASIPVDTLAPRNGSSQNGTIVFNNNANSSLPLSSTHHRNSLVSGGSNGGIYAKGNNCRSADYFNCMSFMRAFAQIIREHQDIASQHELIAENVRSGVLEMQLLKEIREQKKRSMDLYKERKRDLEKQMESANKALRRYETAYQVCSKATETYERANEDINLSRAQVERNRMAMNRKNAECEQIRIEYNGQIDKFNEAKNAFYREDLVRVYGELEEFNTTKINRLKDAFETFVDSHVQVVPRIKDCLRQMNEAIVTINPDVDSVTLMDNLKTGYPYPDNQIPIDLKSDKASRITSESAGLFGRRGSSQSVIAFPTMPSLGNGSSTSFASKSNTIRRMKRIITPRKKSSNVQNVPPLDINPSDFDHLPPAQRLKSYHASLDELNKQISTKQREREALAKMQTIYTENPRFGETEQVDEKLHQTDLAIITLSNHAKKFENLITVLTKTSGTSEPIPEKDEEYTGEEENKPDYTKSEFLAPNPPMVEQVTVVGNAMTQYAFDAVHHAAVTKGTKNPVNMLSFEALEQLDLIEPDLGDGWIKVLRRTTGEIGFVPSSYCNIHLFDRIVVDFD